MEILKPLIVIKVNTVYESILKEVLAGIEEEGVMYSVQTYNNLKDVMEVAHNASLETSLGIGISIIQDEICVHYKNLETKSPLFILKTMEKNKLRTLGSNAARFAKGISLKNI